MALLGLFLGAVFTLPGMLLSILVALLGANLLGSGINDANLSRVIPVLIFNVACAWGITNFVCRAKDAQSISEKWLFVASFSCGYGLGWMIITALRIR